MGSKSSILNSNSSESEKQSLNSAKIGLENLNYTKKNSHETIRRVWIAKKAIPFPFDDAQILGLYEISKYNPSEYIKEILKKESISIPKIEPLKLNLFNINNSIKTNPKHWAIILELYNKTFVNIKFGRTGISLKEFSNGERCFNAYLAIAETWGLKDCPLSFCYLGEGSYSYRSLLKYLVRKKELESNEIDKKGRIWYNLFVENCQLFACEIEAFIFGEIKLWHSFPYYLEDFYQEFFDIPKSNMNTFESAVKDNIDKLNIEIYKKNMKNIEEYAAVCKMRLSKNDLLKVKNDLIYSTDSNFIKSEIEEKFKKN